jgi:hypothetical protein
MKNESKIKHIKVAILAEEPLGWSSGKHYFPIILDNYTWKKKNITYKFTTTYLFDKDIVQGNLNVTHYDVLLVPGGGVGDAHAVMKGFTQLKKVRRWKNNISHFIKNGGGYVGICGGASLITELTTGPGRKPTTFLERQFNKSALDVSCVTSYYNYLAIPLFYPFQKKHPENVGASGFVFSFAPGHTLDGTSLYTGGVPVDFTLHNKQAIFSDVRDNKLRIRWWGGPAFQVPLNPDREVKVIARYPVNDFSQQPNTRIKSWIYVGGLHGLFLAFLKACRLIKKEQGNFKYILLYTYFLAGDWMSSDKYINLDFSNKPSMTMEIYPNKHQGRILLCAAHPQYLIWHGGRISENEGVGFHCLANGLHYWNEIAPLSDTGDELMNNWWLVRRMVAWAAKVPDHHMPPREKDQFNEKTKMLFKQNMCSSTLLSQMKNI